MIYAKKPNLTPKDTDPCEHCSYFERCTAHICLKFLNQNLKENVEVVQHEEQ